MNASHSDNPDLDQAEDIVLHQLKEMRARPDDRLVESRLAKLTGLGRHTVREVLNRLTLSDVVQYVPYSGYRLRPWGYEDILELFSLRESLEPTAARDAATLQLAEPMRELMRAFHAHREAVQAGNVALSHRRDYELHLAVVRASGNKRLERIYGLMRLEGLFAQRLLADTPPSVARRPPDLRENDRMTVDSHEAIVNAIVDGESFKARDLMAEHIFYARDHFLGRALPRLVRQGVISYLDASMAITGAAADEGEAGQADRAASDFNPIEQR